MPQTREQLVAQLLGLDDLVEHQVGGQSLEVDVLLVSPERLNNPAFRDEVLPALAAAWQSELAPGDFVAILGFTSADFVTVDLATTLLGAPNVPLQAGAPAARIAARAWAINGCPPTSTTLTAQLLTPPS